MFYRAVAVFFKQVKKYLERFKPPTQILYVENNQDPYFVNIKVIGNPVVYVANQRIDELKQKAKNQTLSKDEKQALRGFKLLRANAIFEETVKIIKNKKSLP